MILIKTGQVKTRESARYLRKNQQHRSFSTKQRRKRAGGKCSGVAHGVRAAEVAYLAKTNNSVYRVSALRFEQRVTPMQVSALWAFLSTPHSRSCSGAWLVSPGNTIPRGLLLDSGGNRYRLSFALKCQCLLLSLLVTAHYSTQSQSDKAAMQHHQHCLQIRARCQLS